MKAEYKSKGELKDIQKNMQSYIKKVHTEKTKNIEKFRKFIE